MGGRQATAAVQMVGHWPWRLRSAGGTYGDRCTGGRASLLDGAAGRADIADERRCSALSPARPGGHPQGSLVNAARR